MQIKCPSCGKKFRSEADLTDKTVKCGACEKKFVVSAETLVKESVQRVYPGEKKDDFLERLSSTGARHIPPEAARPNFQPASYGAIAQQSRNAQGTPGANIATKIAVAIGFVVFLLFLTLLIVGCREEGFLYRVDLEKRLALGLCGAMLLFLLGLVAAKVNRLKGALMGLGCGLPLLVVAAMMPSAPTTDETISTSEDEVERMKEAEVTELSLEAKIGQDFFLRQLEKAAHRGLPTESVYGIYFTNVRSKQRLQIRNYLKQITFSDENPVVTERSGTRGDYVYVGIGSQLTFTELIESCARLGEIIEVNETMRFAEIELSQTIFERPSEAKLTDPSNPAFYEVNFNELASVDTERVSDALRRLSQVEPIRNKTETNKRLILLTKNATAERLGEIADALTVWAEDIVPAGLALENRLKELAEIQPGLVIPIEVLRFYALRSYAPGFPQVMKRWEIDPFSIEPLLRKMGTRGEQLLLPYLSSEKDQLVQSAVAALKVIGSKDSLPQLRKLRDTANAEFRKTIDRTIDSIESR